MNSKKNFFNIETIDLNSSLMIEASAGTGKTHSIIEIFFKLILKKEVNFRNILIVTFTKKATQEMISKIREKAEETINSDFKEKQTYKKCTKEIKIIEDLLSHFEEIHISTIHSFCKTIIEQYPFEFNLPSLIEIIENEDLILNKIFLNFLLNIQKDSKISHLDFFPRNHSINKLFLYSKRFLEESQKTENFVLDFINESIEFKDIILLEENEWKLKFDQNKKFCKYLKYIYNQVQQYKKNKGILTYNDLITSLYKTLELNQKLLENLQNQFQVCIIDEFQDTDFFQWSIFKKIFLGKSGNILIAVGDPKQAIYGFRGADLYIYLKAKNEISKHNPSDINSRIFQLSINYRSSQNFVNAINTLFRSVFEHFYKKTEIRKDCQIEYTEIKSKNTNLDNNKNQTLYKMYKPINFIEVNQNYTNLARREAGNIIAKIIYDLVKNYNYKYSEIAILYRSSIEAEFIKKILLRWELPFVDYTNINVFNTLEAIAMEYLLCFLAHPEDTVVRKKFLLYYFIDIPYIEIEVIEQNSFDFQEKISEWNQILEKRNWFQLFYRILEDTKFYYKYLAFPDYERKITNFEHLIEILVEIGTTKKLGAIELYHEFKKLKNLVSEEYELKLDSEDEKIQLLTIHKSKGLEFRTVFIIGWYDVKSPAIGDSHHYKYFDFRNSLWNLCFFYLDQKEEEKKKLIEREVLSEELRLFYVAITRAKELAFCVLPYIQSKPSYFFHFIGLTEEFKKNTNNTEINFFSTDSFLVKESTKEKTFSETQSQFEELSKSYEHLNKLESNVYTEKRYFLYSYSSLERNINKKTFSELDESDYDEEFLEIEEMENKESKNLSTKFDFYFPPSVNTGNCIHKIFQIISFCDFLKYNKNYLKNIYKKRIEYLLKFYSFHFDSELEDFLYNFLHTILSIRINNEFSLKEIPTETIKKEISFLIQNLNPCIISKLPNSYITGNIDLFFEHNNKFYLLDYKTTTLFQYDVETLKEFTDNHYKIQYLLYSYALYLWLDKIKKINLKEHLETPIPGGIIYFYLRGYESESKGIDFRHFLSFNQIKEKLEEIL